MRRTGPTCAAMRSRSGPAEVTPANPVGLRLQDNWNQSLAREYVKLEEARREDRERVKLARDAHGEQAFDSLLKVEYEVQKNERTVRKFTHHPKGTNSVTQFDDPDFIETQKPYLGGVPRRPDSPPRAEHAESIGRS